MLPFRRLTTGVVTGVVLGVEVDASEGKLEGMLMASDGLTRLHRSRLSTARPLTRAVRSAFAVLALALPVALDAQQATGTSSGTGQIALIREVGIGTDTAGPDYEFAGIGHAAVIHSGTIFVSVANGSEVLIRIYDPSGRFLGTVGRTGSGPGEYRGVQGMAVVGDTLLVVLDRANGRVVLFDTTGVYRGSFRVSGTHTLKGFGVYEDGSFAVRTRVAENAARGSAGLASVFVRYRPNGEIRDSVRVPSEDLSLSVLVHRSLGPRWPFSATTVFSLLPRGGIATATTTTYRVDVAPAQAPRFVIERPSQPIPLTGREREEWAAMQSADGGAPLPRRKPIIRDLFADMEGRIWVDLYTEATQRVYQARPGSGQRPSLTMWEHNAYDVFDERGRYLGRVDLPPFSRLLAVLGNRIWLAQETEDGGYVLVRCLLRMPLVR